MRTSVENIPGNLWQYTLVANPDDDVRKKVLEVRRDFGRAYDQQTHSIDSEPHIMVASFMANDSMEETLIRWMQRIFSQYKGFPVLLNNYSGFPCHSIYLRVQHTEPFRQLALQLRIIDEYVISNGCPPVRLVSRPHIAIASGLDEDVYNRAMADYSQKTFHESFHLPGLVLLKRSSQFDACSQVNVFRFYPPDTNIYGEVA